MDRSAGNRLTAARIVTRGVIRTPVSVAASVDIIGFFGCGLCHTVTVEPESYAWHERALAEPLYTDGDLTLAAYAAALQVVRQFPELWAPPATFPQPSRSDIVSWRQAGRCAS
jgi:hypothetical protein